jgi:biotin-(acetyl-CoA carboxylase) ligase
MLSNLPVDRERLLADVLSHVETELTRLARHGLAGLAEALGPYDALQGRPLRVDALEGVGAGIDADGRLLVRSADGRTTPVLSGHVELLDQGR